MSENRQELIFPKVLVWVIHSLYIFAFEITAMNLYSSCKSVFKVFIKDEGRFLCASRNCYNVSTAIKVSPLRIF